MFNSINISNAIQLDSISNQEKLTVQNIQPIHEPPPVDFAFETIGWTILLVIAFIIVLIFAIRWFIHYQKNKYRRDALTVLYDIENQLNKNSSIEINNLIAAQLKFVAIQSYGRKTVANLYGKEWVSFLQSTGKNIAFNDFEEFLLSTLYQNKMDHVQSKKFLKFSKKWISTHA